VCISGALGCVYPLNAFDGVHEAHSLSISCADVSACHPLDHRQAFDSATASRVVGPSSFHHSSHETCACHLRRAARALFETPFSRALIDCAHRSRCLPCQTETGRELRSRQARPSSRSTAAYRHNVLRFLGGSPGTSAKLWQSDLSSENYKHFVVAADYLCYLRAQLSSSGLH
jgi:hypothetical protein